MNTLNTYGWDDRRAAEWTGLAMSGYIPARVVADHGGQYRVACPDEIAAQLAGSLMHKLKAIDMPKIGDWVAIERTDDQPAIIQSVLTRRSEIVRGHVGRLIDKQVIAANIDLAFIVQPLDHDFSPTRLERYIFQLSAQNIDVVILLNKADKALDAADKQIEIKDLKAESIVMSALNDTDLSRVEAFIQPGQTIVVMGSSGAGKSTLINKLLGEERQKTQSVRERDSKGRHTTVHRELFVLPNGGLIIDTPGIRELQLWGDYADLEVLFPEIFDAIRHCHYPNCQHDTESQCAVKAGFADGTIDPVRFRIYTNFKQELDGLEKRRGYIAERKSAQSKESFKRRRLRDLRHSAAVEMDDE